jgi:2-hydroxychromene-2-carboxylate isomerase
VPAPLFFLGAMSPYSWISAERIGGLIPDAEWRHVFLGGVFKGTGRTSWGFGQERAEGMADCEARASRYGLGPIRWPARWPTNDLHAARAMTLAARHGQLEEYALSAMRMAFLEAADLGELEVVLEAGRRVGIDEDTLRPALDDPEIKSELRDATDEALSLGVFGVPTFVVAGEVFWGDDRLEDAAAAAGAGSDASGGSRSAAARAET